MNYYWQLIIHQRNGENRVYCYITYAAAREAYATMIARGARAAIRKQYV